MIPLTLTLTLLQEVSGCLAAKCSTIFAVSFVWCRTGSIKRGYHQPVVAGNEADDGETKLQSWAKDIEIKDAKMV